MDKVYSRNLAHRQIFVAKFAQKSPQENKEAESIADGQSVFLEECLLDATPMNTEFKCLKPADCSIAILKTGNFGRLKKGPYSLKGFFR